MSERMNDAPSAEHPWDDRFVMRTPLLSADAFRRWGEGLHARAAYLGEGDLAQAIAHDRARLRSRLARVLTDPCVQEAVALASPGVGAGIESWVEHPDRDKAARNLERALVGYFTRMTTRATPFGLLSGCSVGEASTSTHLAIGSRADARRHVELDADAVYAMADRIGRDAGARARDRLYANTTAVRITDRLCYVESRDTEAGRSYDLVSVAASELLAEALEAARYGCPFEDVVARLTARAPDVERAHVVEFVGELIEHQILRTSLIPAVTGAAPGRALAQRCRAIESPHAVPLGRALARLDALNAAPLGAAHEEYERTRAELAAVLDPQARHVFHASLHRGGTRSRLGPEVLETVRRTAQTLSRIAPPLASPFGAFVRAFSRRYGSRWVGLAEALNEEHGIGFGYAGREPAPLLRGLAVGGAGPSSIRMGRADRLRVALWQQAVGTGAQDVELSPDEIERWARAGRRQSTGPTHRAFAATFMLAASDDAAPEVVFLHAAGPCGANTLARFCQSDPEVEELVRRHIAREESGAEALVAELVHIPEGRHANVIGRPALRRYEIPYLGRASVEPEYQLPIGDLEVTVRDGAVVLRSRRHSRPVLVRLTCAHDYSRSSLAVYRFLGALARQDAGATAAWSWGAATEAVAKFLPRVRLDGAVVSLARWKLTDAELVPLRSADTAAERFAAAQGLRTELRLPRWVTWGVGDRQLVVDFDNSLSVDAFVHGMSGDGPTDLQELYPTPDRLVATGEDGRYVAELCVPFVVPTTPRPVQTPRPPAPEAVAVTRRFDPGSSWLYARLYTGAAACDRVLNETLVPLLERAERQGVVDQWFFVRYADPDWHLRVRAQGEPGALLRELIPQLTRGTQQLAAGGLSWKTELGTYEREVERYGGDAGIELAERIFAADSGYAAQCLRSIGADQDVRWHLTVAGLDTLLGALGFDLPGKLEVTTALASSFGRELGGSNLDKQLADRFRTHRRRIEAILAPDAEQGLSAEHRTIVGAFADRLRQPADALARAAAAQTLCRPLPHIAASLLHMHVNRMVRGDARAQEAVLYDLLRRTYRSALGRARHERKAVLPCVSNSSIPITVPS